MVLTLIYFFLINSMLHIVQVLSFDWQSIQDGYKPFWASVPEPAKFTVYKYTDDIPPSPFAYYRQANQYTSLRDNYDDNQNDIDDYDIADRDYGYYNNGEFDYNIGRRNMEFISYPYDIEIVKHNKYFLTT